MVINIVLANRAPNSISGVATNFANALVRRGHNVTISYPRIDNYIFALWENRKKSLLVNGKIDEGKFFLRMLKVLMMNVISRTFWSSFTGGLHSVPDQKVRLNPYFVLPSKKNMPNADFLLIFQEYLLSKTDKLGERKGKIVSSIRIEYDCYVQDRSAVGDFYRAVFSIARQYNVPRFAVSRAALLSARSLGVSVDTVIHNGININVFKEGRDDGQNRPLNITCLIQPDRAQKGAEWGLEIMRGLKQRMEGLGIKNYRLICFGSDLNVSSKNGLLTDIFDEVHGFLVNKPLVELLQRTDIFIFPSYYEGFPSMVLEAMACGCVVVSGKVAGLEHLIDGESVCFVAEPGNHLLMIEHILKLAKDEQFRLNTKQRSLAKVKKFSWDAVGEELETFLLSLRGKQCAVS